jgi:hypothetical protein
LVQPIERLTEPPTQIVVSAEDPAATALPTAIVRPKKKSQPVPEKIIVTPRKKIKGW